MIEGTLDRMGKCSQQHGLNIEANLLKPMYEESFWVNIIGRGSPPPAEAFLPLVRAGRMEVGSSETTHPEYGVWPFAVAAISPISRRGVGAPHRCGSRSAPRRASARSDHGRPPGAQRPELAS